MSNHTQPDRITQIAEDIKANPHPILDARLFTAAAVDALTAAHTTLSRLWYDPETGEYTGTIHTARRPTPPEVASMVEEVERIARACSVLVGSVSTLTRMGPDVANHNVYARTPGADVIVEARLAYQSIASAVVLISDATRLLGNAREHAENIGYQPPPEPA